MDDDPYSDPFSVEKYPIAEFTFGAELEMCYVLKRSIFYAWLNKPDPDIEIHKKYQPGYVPPPKPPTAQISSPILNGGSASGSGSSSDDVSEISPQSTKSDDAVLQQNLRDYFIAYLNHDLPGSPATTALTTRIVPAEVKTGNHEFWNFSEDGSVIPHRTDYVDVTQPDLDHQRWAEEIKKMKLNYLVGGGEISSCVLDYEDPETWQAGFAQIYGELTYNGNLGVWLAGNEGLHIHFGMWDNDMPLDFLKILLQTYGLFEREIEMWMPINRRNLVGRNQVTHCYSASLRLGMEDDWYEREPDYFTATAVKKQGLRYTPRGYTKVIQDCKSTKELALAVHGGNPEEVFGFPDDAEALKEVTVFISPERRNKMVTVEFRHHEATTNADDIKWWVLFLGHIMRYCDTRVQCKQPMVDFITRNPPDPADSMVTFITETSILDLIAFPEEGKEHFRKRKIRYNNEGANALRRLDERLIEQRRLRRLLTGQRPGRQMDNEIMKEDWFVAGNKALLRDFKVELKQPARFNEKQGYRGAV